jgi:uncharacterized protein (UPF0332 family)
MSMDPRAFLDLAKRLLEKETNPEGLRSTVGRAYYAAFNVAAEFLAGIGASIPKDASGHKKAQFYLNNSQDETLQQVAGDLDDLRGVRNDADYRLDKKHVEKEANVRNWVDVADEIIKCLDECKSGPVQRRNDVAEAVKDYKKKSERGGS